MLWFAKPSEKTGVERWTFTPCTAPERWGQYQHGLGVGDVNGDGRPDLLMQGGWWEQPAARAPPRYMPSTATGSKTS